MIISLRALGEVQEQLSILSAVDIKSTAVRPMRLDQASELLNGPVKPNLSLSLGVGFFVALLCTLFFSYGEVFLRSSQ